MRIIIGGVDSRAVDMKFPIRIKLNNESCQFQSYKLKFLSSVYTKRESKFDYREYFQQHIFYDYYEQLLNLHNFHIFKADQKHELYNDLFARHNEIMSYLIASDKSSMNFNEVVGLL